MALINFSGIASGLDTEGLIKASSDATRATRVKPLQDRVSDMTETNDALTELKSKLNKVRSAVEDFRTVNAGGILKQANSSSEATVSAVASTGAANGSYTINITQKAQNGVFTFSQAADGFSDPNAVINASIDNLQPDVDRTLTFEIGTGSEKETISVVLTNTTTWAQLMESFSSSKKAVLSAVNTAAAGATPEYHLSLSSLYQGTEKGTIAVSRGAELTTRAIFNPATATTQPAQNSIFDIAGIGTGLSRATNDISDVIDGVTFSLNATTGSATINVSADPDSTTTKAQAFVDAWNDVIKYFNTSNKITRDSTEDGASNTLGPLRKVRVDDAAVSAMRGVLSSVAFGTTEDGLTVRLMADLGIQTDGNTRDGTILFKTDKFKTALSTEPNSVNNILKEFADKLGNSASSASTPGVIDQYTGLSRLIDQTITSNTTSITDTNKRIADLEKQISDNETALRARYAALEATIGKLQQTQSTLSSALAGLG